jgi:3-dehydroquinate dehydratase type I
MTHRICVSILPQTVAEALRLIEKVEESRADFIEVRLDNLETNADLSGLVAKAKTSLIATDKASRTETEHQAILFNAARNGFDYIDVALSNPAVKKVAKDVKALGAKCIISFHDNKVTPDAQELNRIFADELVSGADVCKIVTTATQIEDNLTLLNFISTASAKAKIVCFCMGELGKTSRLLSPMFGGFFTFAALEQGSETATGQRTVVEIKDAYDLWGLK